MEEAPSRRVPQRYCIRSPSIKLPSLRTWSCGNITSTAQAMPSCQSRRTFDKMSGVLACEVCPSDRVAQGVASPSHLQFCHLGQLEFTCTCQVVVGIGPQISYFRASGVRPGQVSAPELRTWLRTSVLCCSEEIRSPISCLYVHCTALYTLPYMLSTHNTRSSQRSCPNSGKLCVEPCEHVNT